LSPRGCGLAASGSTAELGYGDILDPQSLESAARGCELVFHLAAPYVKRLAEMLFSACRLRVTIPTRAGVDARSSSASNGDNTAVRARDPSLVRLGRIPLVR